MTIKKLTDELVYDLHKANQPFDIIGRMDITFSGGKWDFKEVIFDTVTEKQYPNYDGAVPFDYIEDEDRDAFLVYENGECVGQMLIAASWNGYAHIEDLSVARAWRGKGIGTSLLKKAAEWAKEKGFFGISLESQDNNLLATRFYLKNGMHIGSVDTQLYHNLGEPYNRETAVFWYLDF